MWSWAPTAPGLQAWTPAGPLPRHLALPAHIPLLPALRRACPGLRQPRRTTGTLRQPQAAPLGKMSCEASSSTSPARGSPPPAAIVSPRATAHTAGSGSAEPRPERGVVLETGRGSIGDGRVTVVGGASVGGREPDGAGGAEGTCSVLELPLRKRRQARAARSRGFPEGRGASCYGRSRRNRPSLLQYALRRASWRLVTWPF